MMGITVLRIGAIAIAIAAGAASAAAQQQPLYDVRACEGEISSLALASIPAADAYAVDIFDPTDLALRFRDIFLTKLNAADKATRADGNLVFRFRSESIFRGIAPRAQVHPTYRGERGTSRSSPRAEEDETRELIRSDRRSPSDVPASSQQVIIEAELRNEETQRVIWMATVHCTPLTDDRNALMGFVSQVFVENLGLAVKKKAF